MRKSLYILILLTAICYLFPVVASTSVCHSQVPESYFYHARKADKYFFSVAYGEGTARWNSVFKNADFYDKDGAVINSGDFKFSATNPTKHLDANVSAPFKKIRLGLGISFEEHYMNQLRFYNKKGDEILLFDETMRFDKLYFHSEVPFHYATKNKYSFNWNFRLGWYGYTNVRRVNFLGDKPFPVSFLVASGVTMDYEIYPKVFIFIFPNLEYKYYSNSGTEAPVEIRHNVFTANVLAGVRVNFAQR